MKGWRERWLLRAVSVTLKLPSVFLLLALIFLLGCAGSSTTRPPIPRQSDRDPRGWKDRTIPKQDPAQQVTPASQDDETRISMKFKDARLSNVLAAIAREYDMEIVTDEEVDARVTVSLRKATLEEALEAILSPLKYGYIIEGTQIRVIHSERKVTRVFHLNYSEALALADALSEISPTATVRADTLSNSLIITDQFRNIKVFEEVIQHLDATRQVIMIEAEIFEISLQSARNLGLYWSATWSKENHDVAAQSPFKLQPENLLMTYGYLKAPQLQAFLAALQNTNDARLLSHPRIVTLNGKRAQILVGERVPYIRRSTATPSGGLLQEVEFVEVGIKLAVTPWIANNSDLVVIDVHPEVSEVLDKMVQGVPRIGTREANTRVAVRNGETVVIGGLIRKNKRKVSYKIPILGDLFFLGWLFKNRNDESQESELIVFITPRLLSGHQFNNINWPKEHIRKKLKLDKKNIFFK